MHGCYSCLDVLVLEHESFFSQSKLKLQSTNEKEPIYESVGTVKALHWSRLFIWFICGNSWLLLATLGYFLLLLSSFSFFWLLLDTYGYFWLFMTTLGYFGLQLATLGYFRRLLATIGRLWLILVPLATFGYFQLPARLSAAFGWLLRDVEGGHMEEVWWQLNPHSAPSPDSPWSRRCSGWTKTSN